MNKKDLTTEDLIIHENEIDWEELSENKERSFNLSEIRIFRKRINWAKYLMYHEMSPIQMEVASKYFDNYAYRVIAIYNLATPEFIEKHKDDFDWDYLLAFSTYNAKLLDDCLDCWKNIPKNLLERYLCGNSHIDIYDDSFAAIRLYIGLA